MFRTLAVFSILAVGAAGVPASAQDTTAPKAHAKKGKRSTAPKPAALPEDTPPAINPDPNRPTQPAPTPPVTTPKPGKNKVRPNDPTAPKPKQPVKDS